MAKSGYESYARKGALQLPEDRHIRLAEGVGFELRLTCSADYVGFCRKDYSASLTSSLNRLPSATAN
jgi:hypothetical protein